MSRSTLRVSAINAEIRKAQTAAPAIPATKASAKAAAREKAAAAAAAAPKGAGEIRIIGGLWKRTRLQVASRPGLRPTPDRVRETLFNWLGQDLSGWRCLDAFAGTGALGLEAASRGAAAVQLVENDAALVAQLHKLQQRLEATAVRVQRGDGVAALGQAAPGSLDLVLLDPPFDSELFEPALKAAAGAVAAGGFIYLEAPAAWTDERLAPLGLALYRHLKAGAVHAHLLRPLGAGAAPA
ncbi:16S rRNA (guanine(966)-N(2))-methyltransferase RsmD [Acidovorax sp. RAC01]|mgnify:CR=1 FL=1|uniref:16S rRNA (guanine(966)-N(2))-methyltransferase RsmD n=1 Tax=Acidovorax sp. RAC01 TaxID=1842533 RepID=UPI00083E7074|nr:16S rRNA (guanine(966)-N(2))-methyltransferase RsmD [Acidovorax sp. RAC01]AOG21730.1 16S rRNA (guanine(966)-N(2))-methyltransferase RsmD [Acidovorax sp. RAC01]